jgi:glycosyltransferase involved in cell wall biosynthesis
VRTAGELARYARNNEISILHTHGKGAGAYGRVVSALTGIPCVHTPHGIHVGSYGAVALRLYRCYENLTSRWVNRLIYVSNDEQLAARRCVLWPRVASSVIVNGVVSASEEALRQGRREARSALGFPEERLLVVTLSRFDYQKNMGEAYAIAKRHPGVNFVWVGDGPDHRALRERAQSEGANHIHFPGAMDDPASLLAAADIYLSTSRWEGMPLAVLEAMAAGLPLVATDVTGHRELIGSSHCGLLYELGDVDAGSSFLTELLANLELRGELGAKGRAAQLRLYSCEAQAQAVAALYDELLADEETI